MTLKKTLASTLQPDGTWSEQQDIDMHPLEEAEIKAHWAIHDAQVKIPEKATKEQEHEWLIEHGAEFVKQKRAEWKKIHDEHMPAVEAAHKHAQDCAKKWCKHVESCVKKNLDYNTHGKENYYAESK